MAHRLKSQSHHAKTHSPIVWEQSTIFFWLWLQVTHGNKRQWLSLGYRNSRISTEEIKFVLSLFSGGQQEECLESRWAQCTKDYRTENDQFEQCCPILCCQLDLVNATPMRSTKSCPQVSTEPFHVTQQPSSPAIPTWTTRDKNIVFFPLQNYYLCFISSKGSSDGTGRRVWWPKCQNPSLQ